MARDARGRFIAGSSRGATVKWNGPAVTSDIRSMVARRLDAAAIIVEEEARDSMTRVKTGDRMGKFTRRSAPGEPPASQHGEAGLLGSVGWRRNGELRRQVGTNKDYGKFLELGTATMAARPWLVRALVTMGGEIKRLFAK